MTKKELIVEFNKIGDLLDDAHRDMDSALDTINTIYKMVENLPSEEDEIDNSEKEK